MKVYLDIDDVLSVSRIRLGTVEADIPDTLYPTCVFLDFLLLGKKSELGECQVTVLPEI